MLHQKSFTRRARTAVAAMLALLFTAVAGAATPEELEAKLQVLVAQVQALQGEVAALKAQQNAPAPAALAASAAPASGAPALSWFGYGEINYSRPDDSNATSADVGRFVLGTSYSFDDKTRLVSELEVEHAVASSDDSGEVEVEQAYIERQLSDATYTRFGLFLIPSGMLNESHEPTRYYGVFRNTVETAIIPSTWREIGASVQGTTAGGFRWNVGLTTGSRLSAWDATSSEGIESPLGAIHQEGQLALAKDLSGFFATNYTGIPGLRLGASI